MISASSTIDLDVEKSGNFRSTEFRIKNNAKMFKILSSGLYKNKIRAITREFSTNCCDSHITNGNPNEPFTVKLPNLLDPNFIIRDYGVGLTEREVREIYTMYGESTKDTLNTLNGTFGLGAKSVFSYTDACTLHSYKDGIKTSYSLHVNERGIPECSRLVAVKTQERNGVEIVIPVQRGDFDQFRREAELVYTFFDIKPIVTGNTMYKENKLKVAPVLEEKGDWAVYDNQNDISLFQESKCIAVMANTCYPVDLNALGISTYNHWLFGNYNTYVIFHLGIGDIDITVSREGCEYIPHTIKCLKEKIDHIEKAYKKKLEDELDKCDCFWDACIKYNSQPLRLLNVSYKGKQIVSSKGNPLYDAQSTINGDPQDILELPSGYVQPKAYHVVSVQYGKGYKFYLDDIDGKKAHSRVNYDISNSSVSRAYIIKTTDVKKIKKFKDEIGILDRHITNVSTLPDPPKKTRSGTTQKVAGYRLKTRNNSSLTYNWERLDQVPPGSLVVAFDNMYLRDKDGTQRRPEYLQNLLQNVPKSFGIDIEQVYALSEKKFEKAAASGFELFWDEFYLQLDKELKKSKADYELLLEYHNEVLNGYAGGANYGVKRYPNIDELFDSLGAICPIVNSKFLDSLKVIVDNVQTLSKGGDAQKVINLTNETKRTTLTPSKNLRTLVDAIYEKAPLLRQINWYDQSSYSRKKYPHIADSVAQYLKFVL